MNSCEHLSRIKKDIKNRTIWISKYHILIICMFGNEEIDHCLKDEDLEYLLFSLSWMYAYSTCNVIESKVWI